jgi:hypothetical protein
MAEEAAKIVEEGLLPVIGQEYLFSYSCFAFQNRCFSVIPAMYCKL